MITKKVIGKYNKDVKYKVLIERVFKCNKYLNTSQYFNKIRNHFLYIKTKIVSSSVRMQGIARLIPVDEFLLDECFS